MNQSLDVASHEIRALVDKLLKEGMTSEAAQTHIAEELSSQAKRDQSVREKLLQWAEELTKSTVSEVAKNVVKTAIRLAGIPLP